MHTQATQSEPFEKVRHDHSVEKAEDYVEAVADIIRSHGECRVKHLARRMGVSHVTVTRIVGRLEQERLLEKPPYRPIRLTASGARLAARSRSRHEAVVAFLRALGVSADHARRDAEGIEHHVGEETLRCMRRFTEQRAAESEPPNRAMKER
jgi:DtxR family manganese transport transcriptional regulator